MNSNTAVPTGQGATVNTSTHTNGAQEATPERISALSEVLSSRLNSSIAEIQSINLQTKLLSFNAQIEAARAGAAGAAFGVVASEMNNLSSTTTTVCEKLRSDMLEPIQQLQSISTTLATNVRGTRLADLALVNIDLIDRNLYERSCDVRWWATDAALVKAAATRDAADCKYAGDRMAVILGAYTVYADLVLCDLDGNVLANGKPDEHRIRRSFAEQEWFMGAMETRSGEQFAFQTVHRMPEMNDAYVLVYSCAVRKDGDQHAAPIGVLGIIFKWESLAQTIMKNTPVSAEEKPLTRCLIVADDGTILADSQDQILGAMPEFPERGELFQARKSFRSVKIQRDDALVAHALSPGFETYATGWHSVIIQQRKP